MKIRQFIIPIVTFLIGIIIATLGTLLKIIHFEMGLITGNLLITIGLVIKVIAVIWTIIRLVAFSSKQ